MPKLPEGFVIDQESEVVPKGFEIEGPSKIPEGFTIEKAEETPNFFERIYGGVKTFIQNQTERAKQEAIERQNLEAEAEAIRQDPRFQSSTEFKRSSPKPQTTEEQAIYDATIAKKKFEEKKLAEELLPDEMKKPSIDIEGPEKEPLYKQIMRRFPGSPIAESLKSLPLAGPVSPGFIEAQLIPGRAALTVPAELAKQKPFQLAGFTATPFVTEEVFDRIDKKLGDAILGYTSPGQEIVRESVKPIEDLAAFAAMQAGPIGSLVSFLEAEGILPPEKVGTSTGVNLLGTQLEIMSSPNIVRLLQYPLQVRYGIAKEIFNEIGKFYRANGKNLAVDEGTYMRWAESKNPAELRTILSKMKSGEYFKPKPGKITTAEVVPAKPEVTPKVPEGFVVETPGRPSKVPEGFEIEKVPAAKKPPSKRKPRVFDTAKAAQIGDIATLIKAYGKFSFPAHLKGEIGQGLQFKKSMGKLFPFLKKDAQGLDEILQELKGEYPELFNKYETDADLLRDILGKKVYPVSQVPIEDRLIQQYQEELAKHEQREEELLQEAKSHPEAAANERDIERTQRDAEEETRSEIETEEGDEGSIDFDPEELEKLPVEEQAIIPGAEKPSYRKPEFGEARPLPEQKEEATALQQAAIEEKQGRLFERSAQYGKSEQLELFKPEELEKAIGKSYASLGDEGAKAYGSIETYQKNLKEAIDRLRRDNPALRPAQVLRQITEYIQKKGYVPTRGLTVQSPEDIAEIVSIWRNPGIEVFQAVYVKGGKVVAHHAISMNIPGWSAVPRDFIKDMNSKGEELGADKIYVAHNHPSGTPKESREDVLLTKFIMGSVGKYAGHVITDGDNFTFINELGDIIHENKYKTEKINFQKEIGLPEKVTEPTEIVKQVQSNIKDGKRTLVFLNNRHQIIAFEYLKNTANLTESIFQKMRAYLAPKYAIITTDPIGYQVMNNDKFITSLPSGLVDIMHVDRSGMDSFVYEAKWDPQYDQRIYEQKDPFTKGGLKGKTNKELSKIDFEMGQMTKVSERQVFFEFEEEPIPDVAEVSAKKWQVEMPKEPETKKQINKTEIIRFVEDTFKIAVRGKLTHVMKTQAGFYKTKAELIRLKKWGELEVLTHEVAHHIDFGILADKLGKNWKSNLAPEGRKGIVRKELADLDYNPKRRDTSEGFAEFIRHWVTDTGELKHKAPSFLDLFENKFLKEQPEIAKNLGSMKDLYTIWKKQGALNRTLGQIDFKGEHTKDPVQIRMRKAWSNFYNAMVDELYPIKRVMTSLGMLSRQNVRPTKDPYEMATFLKSKSSGVARTFITKAAVDIYGKKIGPSLAEILEPVIGTKDIAQVFLPTFLRSFRNSKLTNFMAYWIARRAMNLEGRNKESGFDVNDMKFIIEKFDSPEFQKTAEQLTKWSNHFVDHIVDAGGLSPETAELFRTMNPIYVPFKRAFMNELMVYKGAKQLFAKSSGFWGIKGSGRPIINPIESLINSTGELLAKAHKIRIANLIADLAEEEGAGGFITEIPLARMPVKVKTEEVFKNLADMGIELEERTESETLDEFMTFFQATAKTSAKDNTVAIFRKGKLKLYELHPDLYKALQGVQPIQLGPIMKVLSGFTRLKRLGATGLNAVFGLARNPIKDFLTATVFSKHKTFTPLDPLKGLFRELTAKPGSPEFRFKAAGGDLSSMMGFDRAQTMAVFDDVLLDKLKGIGKTLKIIKHPVDALRKLLNIPEMAPRMAELRMSMNKYRKQHPDWTEDDVFVAAFNDAQDITINFTRSGTLGKQYNQLVFAFNAAIQGISKIMRSLKEQPIQTIVKGIAALTIPALWLWSQNKDKQWYKNLEPAYKYNNLWWEDGDTVYRIPIPYDIGALFSSMPVAMMDFLERQDPDYAKGLLENIGAQIPLDMPDVVSPVWDVATNKDWLNRPIESMGMKFKPSEERRHEYTAPYAIYLSRGFNSIGIELSPLQIEYLVNSYTGGLVRRTFEKKAAVEGIEKVPVLGSFVQRIPEKPTRQLNNFYERLEDLRQEKNVGKASPKELRELKRYNLIKKNIIDPAMKRIRKYQTKENVQSIQAIRQEYKRMTKRLNSAGVQ